MMKWGKSMNQHFDLVIFDVDGTLLDTSEGLKSSVNYTIEKHGLAPLNDEILDSFIGPPIQDSFSKAYGLEGNILQELATTFRDRYKEYDLLRAKPYAGIYEVFEKLSKKGIRLAIATYKRQDYALSILKHFGFDRFTDIMYGADHENKLKKQDIIEKCLKDAEVSDYSRAVMVGDSDNDAIGAVNIGTKFIGVTYGYGFKNVKDVEKYPSVGVANTPLQLLKYF